MRMGNPPWQRGGDASPDAPLLTRRVRHRDVHPPAPADGAGGGEVDLVAPAIVDRRALEYVRSGQSFVRVFAVQALPRWLRPAALSSLMALPGVHVAVVNHPVPRTAARQRLADLLAQLGETAGGGDADVLDNDVALRDVRRVLGDVLEERTALHLVGIYLMVYAGDAAQLRARCRQVQQLAADLQTPVVALDGAHWEGMLTHAPLGIDLVQALFETDSQTLARLMPHATFGRMEIGGAPIMYGVRAEGMATRQTVGVPVLLDRFTLPSPHQAVIAATGGGKTYHQSFVLLQRFAYGGCDLCVLDPKDQEYRRLLEEQMGGTYVVLSPNAAVHFNPLALPHGDAATADRIRRLGIDVRTTRASLLKQLLVGEALARSMPLSGADEALIEDLVLEAYDRRGITADPGSFGAAPPPTIAEIAQRAQAAAATDALRKVFDVLTGGVLGRLLHGERSLPLTLPRSRLRDDVGVLGIDLSAFVQGHDQTLQRVAPALLADYVLMAAMRSGRRMEVVIDEAWSVLATTAGAQTIETLGRIGRSLGVAVTIITQQIRDFLLRRVGDRMEVNGSGTAFLDNCETVLLLRQLRPARQGATAGDDHPVLLAGRKLGLTPGEIAWLSHCGRDAHGVTGLLVVGREVIPLRVPRAPLPIHAMIVGESAADAEEDADAGDD